MSLIYQDNVYFKANGKLWTGRTAGIGTPGILKNDIAYSGMVGRVFLGETCVAGDLVYPVSATQDWRLVDPTQGAIKGPAQAILLEGGDADEYKLALFDGYMRYDGWLTTEYLAEKGRCVLTAADGVLDNELITFDTTIIGWDIATEDGVVAGSTDVLYAAAGTKASREAVMTQAVLNAILIANGSGMLVETDWAADELDMIAVNAGLAGNALITVDALSGATAFASGTLLGGTDLGIVYAGDVGKPASAANIPATGNDMVQVIGSSLSPTELLFRPITDYDLA